MATRLSVCPWKWVLPALSLEVELRNLRTDCHEPLGDRQAACVRSWAAHEQTSGLHFCRHRGPGSLPAGGFHRPLKANTLLPSSCHTPCWLRAFRRLGCCLGLPVPWIHLRLYGAGCLSHWVKFAKRPKGGRRDPRNTSGHSVACLPWEH